MSEVNGSCISLVGFILKVKECEIHMTLLPGMMRLVKTKITVINGIYMVTSESTGCRQKESDVTFYPKSRPYLVFLLELGVFL